MPGATRGDVVPVRFGGRLAQILSHVPSGGVPVGRSLAHRLQADAFQFLGDRVVDLARRASFRRGDQVQQFVAGFVFVLGFGYKGSPPSQQFVEHHAQAEDVGTPIDSVPLATGLLRTHVGGSSCDPGTPAEILFLERQSKVGKECVSRGINQDVARLDVSMDQPPCMSKVQGFGDRCHQSRRLVKAGSAFLDPGGKVASLDELGHDEAQTIVGASHVVNRHDMWMIEARNDAGFVQVRLDILGL